jgi:hypothetical protein
MSTQKDDKWLDELISNSVNTSKPEFDAEEWKRKHPEALQSILSRRTKPTTSDQSHVVFHPIAWPTAAAAVIIIVSGLLLIRDKQGPVKSTPKPRLVSQSPTKIVTMMSLRTTYQRGGLEALDQQFQKTLETFGPRPSSVPVQRLLEGLKESEI